MKGKGVSKEHSLHSKHRVHNVLKLLCDFIFQHIKSCLL